MTAYRSNNGRHKKIVASTFSREKLDAKEPTACSGVLFYGALSLSGAGWGRPMRALSSARFVWLEHCRNEAKSLPHFLKSSKRKARTLIRRRPGLGCMCKANRR